MRSKILKPGISLFVFVLSFILLAQALPSAREKIAGHIKFPSSDEVQLASSVIGLRRCKTATEYMFSNGWCYSMTDKIAYTTDFYLGYGIFIDDPQDGERYTWRYYYPDGELYTEQYWEFYLDPTEGCCWRSSLGHLSCGGCAAFLMMGFFLQNNPYLKPGLWTVKIYRDVALFGTDNFTIKCGEKLEITSPGRGDDFDLRNNYIATPGIPFAAVFDPSTVDEKINWMLALEYSTSGGHCGCGNERSFSSDPGETHNESYKSMGGQLTVRASAKVNECEVQAEPVIITITGVQIPDALITERLLNLYHGPTARLMIGLTRVESSYMQFSTRTLYNRTDLWPQESPGGGHHIGLMQVEVTMERAWSWLENTRFGVDHFNEKVHAARGNLNRTRALIREQYGGRLRTLNRTELENMALVYYGPYGAIPDDMTREQWLLTRQYYSPQLQLDGTWDWVVNNQGNPGGVGYVEAVRNNMGS